MSSIDNILIARSVRTHPSVHPQIIALSFHTEEIFKTQVMRAGANQYMVKDEIDHQTLAKVFELH